MEERQSCPLLGELLLASGAITPEELREALYRQGESGRALGEILIEMGSLAPRQLERALEAQTRIRGTRGRSRPLILVVDDDPEVGAVVRDILVGADYRVGLAQNEAEGIAAVLAPDGTRPALVILDLGLPGHGGIELLTILRKNGSTHGIPVVVLTGHRELEPEIQNRGLQISAFLVKPVAARRLVEAVETALREAGGASAVAAD